MEFSTLIFGTALSFLAVASFQDIRRREVYDWVNYAMIASGLGLRLIYSVGSNEWSVFSRWSFLSGLAGFSVCFIISYIMYYAGQWGGGDSKLLMAMGAVIGMDLSGGIPLIAIFWINLALVGAVYGLITSIWLSYVHRKRFVPEFSEALKKRRRITTALLVFVLITVLSVFLFIDDFFIKLVTITIMGLLILTNYLWLYIKTVEKVCMLRMTDIDRLTEGDWIAEPVYVSKEYICGPKDLGIAKEQIEKLKKLRARGRIKKVLVKQGIPFVPSFLVAYIITYTVGNWFVWVLI